MAKYSTESELRERLRKAKGNKTHREFAKELGVPVQMLSMLLSPRYPFTGKAITYLGFRKVRESLFEKV